VITGNNSFSKFPPGWMVVYSMTGLLFLIMGIQVLFPKITIPIIGLFISAFASVDFIVHEFGHVIFGFLGTFIGVMGGTLAQLFIPAICLYLSFWRRQWVGMSIFAFWIGQSLLQISAYIRDARPQTLKLFSPWSLLGGGQAIHDWHYLLEKTGLLPADQFLGWCVFLVGVIFLLASAGIMFARAIGYPRTKFM
jgi:hypothetical protein